jgi:hypothetical protein
MWHKNMSYFCNFRKTLLKVNNHTVGEDSHNLVTLLFEIQCDASSAMSALETPFSLRLLSGLFFKSNLF